MIDYAVLYFFTTPATELCTLADNGPSFSPMSVPIATLSPTSTTTLVGFPRCIDIGKIIFFGGVSFSMACCAVCLFLSR